jgi:hypothetical protein
VPIILKFDNLEIIVFNEIVNKNVEGNVSCNIIV